MSQGNPHWERVVKVENALKTLIDEATAIASAPGRDWLDEQLKLGAAIDRAREALPEEGVE